MDSIPACFDDPDQWREWLLLSKRAGGSKNFCEDCLPEYQRTMAREGRCKHVDTVFGWHVDVGVVGVRKEATEGGWYALVMGHYRGTGKRTKLRSITRVEQVIAAIRELERE